MRKTREILRLKWVLGRSYREIKHAAGVGLATVTDTIAATMRPGAASCWRWGRRRRPGRGRVRTQ